MRPPGVTFAPFSRLAWAGASLIKPLRDATPDASASKVALSGQLISPIAAPVCEKFGRLRGVATLRRMAAANAAIAMPAASWRRHATSSRARTFPLAAGTGIACPEAFREATYGHYQ